MTTPTAPLQQQTYPSGRIVDYDYDPAGRPKFAKDQAKTEKYISMETSNAYWPHGAVKDAQLGNGRWEHSIFNNRLQPTQTGLGATQGSSSLLQLNLTYSTTSNNGNLLTETITAPGLPAPLAQTYSYDGVNRLLSAAETGSWSRTYGYDAFGNRWVDAANEALVMATPTAQGQFNPATNRLTKSFDNVALPGTPYDAAGNLTSHPYIGTMTYDAENRQTSFNGSPPRREDSRTTADRYFYGSLPPSCASSAILVASR